MSPEATNEYGTWSAQRDSLRVEYSLPLFHEIDFAVSESYRRIPHGGIEMGGLLFGRAEPGRVRIDLFRPIHCEHALGPSFKLSDADLATLRAQVENAHADSELRDLQLVGWFISHTRSGLVMNEAELRIFNEVLPGEGKLTVLIKPEKFKPTLFAFLARTSAGDLTEEGAENPVLLPLSGRGANGGGGGPVTVSFPRLLQPRRLSPKRRRSPFRQRLLPSKPNLRSPATIRFRR